MIGYKVMGYEPVHEMIYSGANPILYFPMNVRKMFMAYPEIYLTLNKQHAIDYYQVHNHNALVEVEFDPKTLLTGNLTDIDTEFSVPYAYVLYIKILPSESLA